MSKMTQEKFIERVLHKPWVLRKATLDEMDCYGLIYLYYKHVVQKPLPLPVSYGGDYEGGDFDGIVGNKSFIVKKPRKGDGILISDSNGTATHIGIVINNTHVLHCAGEVGNPGRVSIQSIRSFIKVCNKVTFLRLRQ